MWEQNYMWLFNYFNFETNYDILKSKSPCILLNKNINFNKNETESKMEIPHTVLDWRTLCFSSHSNCKLKVKLWWDIACKRKREGIFCTIYFVWRKFFNISVLSQCIVYWIHFQNIHTFTYQKTLLHTLCCLFLKSFQFTIWSIIVIALNAPPLKCLTSVLVNYLLETSCFSLDL